MKLNKIIGCLFLLSTLFILGCATYQSYVSSARNSMQAGEYESAIQAFKEKYEEANGDKLTYLLEYATVLHQAGRYEESNKAFAEAEKMAELNDYTSVSRETGAMIVQEGLTQFKAEIFEFVLITIYRALNYLMLGDYDNAQVMARRLNEKLNKLSTEMDSATKKRQASFAAYLAALLWESQGDWDNAFVLYAKAHELAPEVDVIKRDVLQSAKRSGRETDYERFQKKWPQVAKDLDAKNNRGKGEFVFIFQQGWIARKQTRPDNKTFPMMVPVPNSVGSVDIFEDNQQKAHSEKVYDLDLVSIQSMEAVFGKLVARALARQASRIAVREAARRSDKGAVQAAALATFIFDALDTADLRQWSTLPSSFQMARLYLSPGKHQLKVQAHNSSKIVWEGEVDIQPNKKTFITQRAY